MFEFNDFRLDPAKRRLLRHGQPVAIPPKAFDTLLYLLRHRHRVVTKDELLAAVWPDTFVEEANLAQNVSVIRRALGESSKDHSSIVTLPGRGYRFTADVRERPEGRGEDSRAYQYFLKGRHLLNKRLTGTLREAISLFVQSTDEDPTYAPAWVGLADAYALLSLYGASRPADVFPKSKAAALAALRLEPGLAEAHNSLGVVELFYEWNWPAAERALHRAIELNPEYADAHQRYGIYLIAMGRCSEATVALGKAQALDPLSRIHATIAGYPAYYSRDFAGAVRQFQHVLEVDPDFSMAHFRLGLALAQLGKFEDACASLTRSMGLSNDRDVVAALGFVYGLSGDRPRAEAAIAELHARSKDTFVSPYAVAVIYAALGDLDLAFDWLDRAVDLRSYWIIYLNVDPALDPLRTDARFVTLQDRVRLPR